MTHAPRFTDSMSNTYRKNPLDLLEAPEEVPGALYRLKAGDAENAGVYLAPIINGRALNHDEVRLELRGRTACVMFLRKPRCEEHFNYDRMMQFDRFNWVVLHEDRLWLTTARYFERVKPSEVQLPTVSA